ncbi:MAG TPA: nitronate monooxygenase [Halanaerobiales bacterium]|nr:nitronate monooxygenase [Halanaerobiales bacterium]
MKLKTPPGLMIGELEAKIPIIQGGMSVGISLSGLASAVANQGGIGVIGAAGIGMLEPDFNTNFKEANNRAFKKEIRKAKEMTDGIIGVNIMLALSDFDELALTAVVEGVDLIFLGAGIPLKIPKTLSLDKIKRASVKIIPIISSARAASIIFKSWARNYNYIPDAVVVEGPLAGGHLGFKKEQINNADYSLENILVDVISVINKFEKQFKKDIPVIAAGGVYTGADIHKFLQLGAQGVQMGSRFVATHECDADINFKKAYIRCKQEDIKIIKSPVGLLGRAIHNSFLDKVSAGKKIPFKCPWLCLKPCNYQNSPYCIALALTNAKRGNLDEGFAFAGTNAYRADKIVSVKELINTILMEYKEEC